MASTSSPAPGTPASPSFAITSPADILSYIPHALGFMPSESLVVLTTAGTRLGATLRVDLPPGGADPLVFAEGVLSFLNGDVEADGTLVVVYSGAAWPRLDPPPRERLVLELEAVLAAAGLPVRGGWFVSGAGWRDYFCRDDHCCPWPGRPLDVVVHSALNAELIFGGSAFDASAPEAVFRAAPAVAPGRATAPATSGAIEDAQAHFAARCSGLWTSPWQFRATSALWDGVLRGSGSGDAELDAEPEVAGFLLASIESRTVRDFLLASACLGSAAALDGASACGLLGSGGAAASAEPGPGDWALPDVHGSVARGAALRGAVAAARSAMAAMAAAPVPPAGQRQPAPGAADAALLYADVLAGRFTGPIAWNRVDAMTGVLDRLAAVSDGESRAAALTMSAWFEYARGRGSRAAVFLEAAEQAVPGYRLARLLSELLRRGGLPAWARRRSTAWTAGTPGGSA